MASEMPTKDEFERLATTIEAKAIFLGLAAAALRRRCDGGDDDMSRIWSGMKDKYAELQKAMNDMRMVMPRQG